MCKLLCSRLLFLVCLCCFWTLPASTQTLMNADSLLRLLPKAKSDTHKVDLLINIGQQYEGSEPDLAAHYYRQAGALSKRLSYTRGVIKYINNYTYILNLNSKYDSSLAMNLEAVSLARSINDSLYLAKALFNAGTSARLLDRVRTAIHYYLEGQRIFERFGNEQIEARGHDILQTLYENMEDYDKAKMHGLKSVSLARKQNDSLLLMNALSNLGMSYTAFDQLDSAEQLYNEALRLSKMVKSDYAENIIMLNMGDLYINQGKFQLLLPWYERALKISTAMDNAENTGVALRGLAVANLSLHNYERALKYGLASLRIADSLHQNSEKQKCLNTLANIYFANRDIATAESLDRQASLLADSINSQRIRSDVAELETIYQLQQKEDRLAQQQISLRQKSTLNYALGALAILLFASLMLVWRTWQQKQLLQTQEIGRLKQDRQLAAAEALMQGEDQERSRMAKDLHDGLGGMLSGIKFSLQHIQSELPADAQNSLHRSLDMLDSSIGEMRRVAHNMMPEALLRFGLDKAMQDYCESIRQYGPLQILYQSSGLEKLDTDTSISITVYRIVQELVNNIIKHANATNALVQLTYFEQKLTVTVEDDGKGFDAEQTVNKGMGWNNILSRVAFLSGHIDVQSKPGEGTSVLIELPVLPTVNS
jgi:two-component system, NarL family, sensor kinase